MMAAMQAQQRQAAAPAPARSLSDMKNDPALQKALRARLDRLLQLPANQRCADCDGGQRTKYASVKLGVFLCNEVPAGPAHARTAAQRTCSGCSACTTPHNLIAAVLAVQCYGIHRNVGAHVTRVKVINLDAWLPDEVELLAQVPAPTSSVSTFGSASSPLSSSVQLGAQICSN